MQESQDTNLASSTALQSQHTPAVLEIPASGIAPVSQLIWWKHIKVGKLVLFMMSLFLFTLAITLMKDGTHSFAPLLQSTFYISSAANCFGFGWLSAYLIMSGSPVAAASLAFFDVGLVDKMGAFAMIGGSRIGASFIVLLIGFLYVLRGRDRATSLSMGLLSLIITGTTYIPAMGIGAIILQKGWLDDIQLRSGTMLQSATDVTIEPIVNFTTEIVPGWGAFLLGLGLILISFNLFDKCLPQMAIKERQLGWMSRLVYRPIVMFALGALVTLVSMSVSISLSVLVPLSNRGFVRRENVIPYIMGANITTFIDTLLAGILLGNPTAFTVVFVGMLTIAAVALLILVAFQRQYRQMTLGIVNWIIASNRNLGLFIFTIFFIPIILVLI
jgi:sodium-dependent phosphate cotransporter